MLLSPIILFSKSERIGFSEEASYLGSLTPAHYDTPKIESYKPRSSVMKIQPAKIARFPKLEKVDGPSPFSYDIEKSFNKVKGRDNSFHVGKQKILTFLDREIKIKSTIPSVGAYDFSKSDNFISKGRKSYR
jgi:hypothetical protein